MAVDVGSAVGYLDLDITGFSNGLKSAQSEANNTANKIAHTAGSSLQSIGDGMSKVGGWATAGITVPIATAVTASVKQFANLEQSIGGVETLFKSSAQTVIDNSETAYKRAGVDANSYMEQVTSFSATLLQGLGGDTEKAAEYADLAIVDMSDNANKMGTSIDLIQNAYQGFAKDNYTMLDNLKLGYGGTASEMARLVNDSGVLNGKFEATAENVKDIPFSTLIDAIHKTQENLGIVGTTAEEAEGTVSGSFGMMKSAALNFLQQLGNPGADMQKFTQQMIDAVKVFAENIKRVLSTIWDNLPISPLQKKLLVAAAAFGPILTVGGKVTSVVGSIVTKVADAVPLIQQFSAGFAGAGAPLASGASSMTAFGAAVGSALGPILIIVGIIAALVLAFKHLWETNEQFRDKMTAIWDGIKGKFEEFFGAIQERLPGLQEAFTNIVNAIKPIWEGFCEILAPIFEGAFEAISTILGTVLDVIIGLLDIFIGVFTGDWDKAWQGVKEIFGSIWDGIVSIFTIAIDTIHNIADVICGWFGTTWNDVWDSIKQFFINVWNSIKQFFVDTWNGITSFFTNTINSIVTGISNFVGSIIDFFAQIPTNISNFIMSAYNAVVDWVTNMVSKAQEMGQNFLQAIVDFFVNLPYNIGYLLGFVLATVATWVVNMVNKAIELGTNFVNAIVTFFVQLPNNIHNIIVLVFTTVSQWVNDMVAKAIELGTNFVHNLITFFVQLPTNFINITTTILTTIGQWVRDMVNKAIELGTNFINNIVNFFIQLPGKILQFITSALNNVKTWSTNMASNARQAGTSFVNNVISFITHLPGKILQILSSIISSLSSWVSSMGQKGREAVSSLINNFISGAAGIGSRVASIGRDIVTGVWNGISNAAGWFTSQVRNFFSGIVDGVKDALGIGSPSKVFRDEVGRWLPPGVVQGFEAAMPSAMKAIQKDLNKGISNIDADNISVGAGITVSGFADKLKSIYNEVALWFESVESRIGNSVDGMMQSLDTLIRAGQVIVNSDGTLGYVGYDGFTKHGGSEDYVDNISPKDKDDGGHGDIFIFNSPKAIDEIEAARQMKKTKQDMAEGF